MSCCLCFPSLPSSHSPRFEPCHGSCRGEDRGYDRRPAERNAWNLTELIIALTALRAGQYVLAKASLAGAIVTNTLFMLGMALLLGGLKHHLQENNRDTARLQAGLLFLATVALLIPSVLAKPLLTPSRPDSFRP
jgi:Sodium/calcium exchanger protein